MKPTRTLIVALTALAAACSGSPTAGALDAPSGTDAPGAPIALPTWALEDVQPQSPRFGQTYGLDTFAGKIVVVTLVEGF